MSLKAKFLSIFTGLAIFFVAATAIYLSIGEENKIIANINNDVIDKNKSLNDIIQSVDSNMLVQVDIAQNILIEQFNSNGKVSLGSSIDVNGTKAFDLVFDNKKIANNFDIVDKVVDLAGGTATIFSRKEDSFYRISTNVKKTDGSRAIGTFLDPNGKAYASVIKGQTFRGVVDILGTPYITRYDPIFDDSKKIIGVLYVGYKINLKTLNDYVENIKYLDSGFIIVLDGKKNPIFKTKNLKDDYVKTLISSPNEDFNLIKTVNPNWNFEILNFVNKKDIKDIIYNKIIFIIALSLTALALFILVIYLLLTMLVLKPLGADPAKVVDILNNIASGNFNIIIKNNGDKNLLTSIISMQQSLRDMALTIKAEANNLMAASSNLKSSSLDLLNDVDNLATQTDLIDNTLNLINHNVMDIKDQSLESSTIANQAEEVSNKSSIEVNESVEELKVSAEMVLKASTSVSDLEMQTDKINQIVAVIKSIANQTNLLALNASIESARAGEAGRGFAVVADEVRKLSENTEKSTVEISQLISELMKSTALSINQIKDSSDHVLKTVAATSQITEKIDNLGQSSKLIATKIKTISDNAENQSNATKEINSAVTELKQLTSNSHNGAKYLQKESEKLNSLANSLLEAVDKFKL